MDTVSSQEKTKRRIIFFVVLFVIAIVIFLVIRTPKNGYSTNKGKQSITINDDDNDSNNDRKDSKDNKKDSEKKGDNSAAQKDNSSVNSYSFVTDSMEVGEESIRKFNIEEIGNVARESYYEISFSLKEIDSYMCTDKDADGDCKPIKDQLKSLVNVSPYVSATYNASLGAIEMNIQDVMRDNAGILHQESRDINRKGVYRIYRSITINEDEEVYDIGVSSKTGFYLESKKQSDGEWIVYLYVKYPSSGNTTAEDLGSTEFSKKLQTIKGATKENNANIVRYTYSAVGGVYKFIWQVSADGENPIPSVSAKLDSDKNVNVVFESMARDGICSSKIYISSGIVLECTKEGDSSSYVFTGTSDYEFKLSASLSPNQVVIEMKKAE
ncbi:hypothetical protein J6Z48_03440 [bacterium]|nr:hypothetical protein [bacterium]